MAAVENRRAGRIAGWADHLARGLAGRIGRPGRPALGWTIRLTLAAAAAYVAAELAFGNAVPPLLAPLTALLVVQLTPVSILVSGFDRVLSVVAGVGLAVLLSSAIGLTWWSLALLIAVSLLVGQVLRLGENLLEVPISAMLVLGVGAGSAEAAAGQRIGETLVGAGIGVLSNLIVPPRVAVPDAAASMERLAQDLASLLEEAADELGSDRAEGQWLAGRTVDWLARARRQTHDIPNVGAALLRAEESRRLNLRALRTADAGPGLRQGLEALEHSAVAVRSMFAGVESIARRWADEGRTIDPQLRAAFALVLHELAGGLRSFGTLVREEASPGEEPPHPERLRLALDGLHEARARMTDLLLVNAHEDLSLGELIVVLGGTVERLLRELDLDERLRRAAPRPGKPRLTVPLPQLARISRPRRR